MRDLDHIVEMHKVAAARRREGRPIWDKHIRLGDIFYDDSISFADKRDQIVSRIRASGWLDGRDEFDELVETVNEGLAGAEDEDEFDAAWDVVYDFADIERVWIGI